MNYRQILLVLFTLNILNTAFADVDIAQCNAYRYRSEELQCSEDDYFINFGERYCQIFVEKNHRFTAYGQEVLAAMRSCLIQSMQSDLTMTCENAKELSEEHHYDCYIESGYCSLGYYDRLQLGWIVRQQFFDLSFFLVSEKINRACTLQSVLPFD